MRKKFIYMTVSLILLAFLLLAPVQAAAASSEGLLLWFHTLLPMLLPFFILSRLLIALDGVSRILSGFYFIKWIDEQNGFPRKRRIL